MKLLTMLSSKIFSKRNNFPLEFYLNRHNKRAPPGASSPKSPCRFKLKYHPEESAKRKEEMRKNLEKRIEVFQVSFAVQLVKTGDLSWKKIC